jgi:hypothetical protein
MQDAIPFNKIPAKRFLIIITEYCVHLCYLHFVTNRSLNFTKS